MLQSVERGPLSIAAYAGLARDELLDRLRETAETIRGARILHLNATAYGGGVSELLGSLVPLMRDLGLEAEWKVMGGDPDFFRVTKSMHNALQGAADGPGDDDLRIYLENSERNAERLESSYDVIFVHDPQPAALRHFRGRDGARWIWRCHIDTSSPNPSTWQSLRPFIADYDAAIFTMRDFVPPDFPVPRVEVVPPAIDPLSPKNLSLPDALARRVLSWIGMRLDRPLITQVARFDPWKDPLGVIAAYRLVREEVPDLQLALVGSMALDDPEGWTVFEQVEEQANRDPDVHVFSNLTGVGNIEVNAFQMLSDVIVQKSIREGFGLVVSEALWKQTPVVAGRAGGIPLQLADGDGGYLVDGVEECAEATVRLLRDPAAGEELAQRGRDRVRRHFLLPRLLLNHLTLACDLLQSPAPGAHEIDPWCGLAVPGEAALRATIRGSAHAFCSESCRDQYTAGSESGAA